MQRRHYANKVKNFMANRAPKLEEIGFPWKLKDRGRQPILWEDHFQTLVEFHRVNRHFNVPVPGECLTNNEKDKRENEAAHQFYKWFSQLNIWHRSWKKGTITRLNQDKVNELQELGFEFGNKDHEPPTTRGRKAPIPVPDISFEKRMEQLQRFQAEIGHLNIDPKFDRWDNFGGWAANMSKRYKECLDGKITVTPAMELQFNELNDFGFQFNVFLPTRNKSWDEHLADLREFQELTGHARVPQKYKANQNLGQWVANQRLAYKQLLEGKSSSMTRGMTPERIAILESVGFVWEVERESTRQPPTEECSEQRINFGLKNNDYCRMCYRKQMLNKALTAAERKKNTASSRMGCSRCQEPICQACWEEGYDKHQHFSESL